MNDFVVKVKDMSILFQKWGNYKRPVIAVRFEGEKHKYKIATFSSEDTAKWFLECLEERIKE